MTNIKELLEYVKEHNPSANLDRIRQAYSFTAQLHKDQVRASGEPYLQHPLSVSEIIVRNLHLDEISIIAGLLHDLVEDTNCSIEDIQEHFGEEIASIVNGLTNIAKIQFKTREEKQAENFRRMLVYMAKDIRVILIKLADRLHNMRTLEYLDETRQVAIAQETLDIYATIANRLGIGWMKSELEDLCLKYLEPELYRNLQILVAKRKEERHQFVKEMEEIVSKKLKEAGINFVEVRGRPKHYYSIYFKMKRQNVPFEEIYDLTALRIITQNTMDCYAVLGILHSLWSPIPGRFKDYIGVPKSNSYRSLHTTVIGPKGEQIEFQVRTEDMDRTAEEGICAHWKYKEYGRYNAKDDALFAWLRQLVEWQKNLPDSRQFMSTVKTDLKQAVIYVFTPAGDLKELPIGSTPVDFAYAVHTEVGNTCIGAKVNKKLVPLRYQLKSGDVVEIITSKHQNPARDWLKFVKTTKAKNKVKLLIKYQETNKSLDIGKKVFERELRKNNISITEIYKTDHIKKLLAANNLKDIDEMFTTIGYGRISVAQLIKSILPDKKLKENIKDKIINRLNVNNGKVIISGINDVLIHLSKCCSPLPGDKIIGFITRGRGISVHTQDCPNIDQLDYNEERLVEVLWDGTGKTYYKARLSISTNDKPGILAEVSAVFSSQNANILDADIKTTEDKKASLNFVIEVEGKAHLEKIIKRITKIKDVINISRVKK